MFLIREKTDSDPNQFNDRRTFARFKARFSLRCIKGNSESRCITLDVSAQGVGFVSPAEFPPNTQVELYLNLPETKEEFMAKGTIVWCRETGKDKFRLGVCLEKPELMVVSQLLTKCGAPPA